MAGKTAEQIASKRLYRQQWGQRNREKLRRYMREWFGYPVPTRPCPAVCECCGRSPSASKGLALDHCHITGVFRGWLCDNCNRGIGQLGDTLESVERAAAYLRRTTEQPIMSTGPHKSL